MATSSHLMTLPRLMPVWLEDRDRDRLAPLFAEDAVWEGHLPGQLCAGRDEIAGRLHRAAERGLHLTTLEVREIGDRVVVHAEGPDLPENEDLAVDAPRTLAFTFRDGVAVHLRTLPPA